MPATKMFHKTNVDDDNVERNKKKNEQKKNRYTKHTNEPKKTHDKNEKAFENEPKKNPTK